MTYPQIWIALERPEQSKRLRKCHALQLDIHENSNTFDSYTLSF